MLCPRCRNRTITIDSRSFNKTQIRRRRKCTVCYYRFSTVEIKMSFYVEFENQKEKIDQFKKLLR